MKKADDGKGQKKQDSSSSLRSGGVQGLGMRFPALKSKKNGKQKVAKGKSHVSEALDKLKEQTREVVKGLESVTRSKLPLGGENYGSDVMMEHWVKQCEELACSLFKPWDLHCVWREIGANGSWDGTLDS